MLKFGLVKKPSWMLASISQLPGVFMASVENASLEGM